MKKQALQNRVNQLEWAISHALESLSQGEYEFTRKSLAQELYEPNLTFRYPPLAWPTPPGIKAASKLLKRKVKSK